MLHTPQGYPGHWSFYICIVRLWIELCPSQNSYIEALTPSEAIFGDSTFKEVMKVELSHKAEVPI